MVRTCALTISLVVLWGSVCTGQQGYEAMAPAGLGDTGLTLAGFNFDQASMMQTLAGVQANLTLFEQSSGQAGLPSIMMPSWAGLLDLGQIQSPQMMTTIDLGNMLSISGGQSSNTALPLSGLTIGSFDMGQFQGLSGL